MTSDIADNVLERFLCHELSLIGVTVEPEDLQACHHMKKKNHFIIKFKCERQKHYALSNRKNLQSKNLVLSPSNFSDKLFQNKHMCHEHHQLKYKYHQLKTANINMVL